MLSAHELLAPARECDGIPAMPDYTPPAEWIDTEEINPCYTGLQYPISKLSDGRVVVDARIGANGQTQAKVWRRGDHENLSRLPNNAPRRVKRMFRADTQLAILRCTDFFKHPVHGAYEAWEDYWEALLMREADEDAGMTRQQRDLYEFAYGDGDAQP